LGGFDSVDLLGTSYGGLGSMLEVSSGVWKGTFAGTVFTFAENQGILSLQSSAIPEPLTAAGVFLLSCRLLGRRGRASL
jgi:hypothetical protein